MVSTIFNPTTRDINRTPDVTRPTARFQVDRISLIVLDPAANRKSYENGFVAIVLTHVVVVMKPEYRTTHNLFRDGFYSTASVPLGSI
jgi:hypothetical protein